MSHFTTIKTEIRDIEALGCAVTELGLSLKANAEARGYANDRLKADYVIRLKGPYDVAVTRQPNGAHELTCDWWDGHVAREVGEKLESFSSFTAFTKPCGKLGAKDI